MICVYSYRPSMQQMSKVHIAYGSKKMAGEKNEMALLLCRMGHVDAWCETDRLFILYGTVTAVTY